jgi:hypothetical protein
MRTRHGWQATVGARDPVLGHREVAQKADTQVRDGQLESRRDPRQPWVATSVAAATPTHASGTRRYDSPLSETPSIPDHDVRRFGLLVWCPVSLDTDWGIVTQRKCPDACTRALSRGPLARSS